MESGRNGAQVLITDQHGFPGAGKENDVDDFENSESRKTTLVFNIFTDFVEGFLEKKYSNLKGTCIIVNEMYCTNTNIHEIIVRVQETTLEITGT